MEQTKENNNICPHCGVSFSCDIAQGKESCWCFELPPLRLVNPKTKGCYCSSCFKKLLNEENITSAR